MTESKNEFPDLADHLLAQRAGILDAWRQANIRDPALASGNALPAGQLIDHIPAILDAFEAQVRHLAVGDPECNTDGEEAAAAHGLHRWQQGYDLAEVIRELGLLNEVMVRELDPQVPLPCISGPTLARARRAWAEAFTGHVEESSARYFELQRLEAAGNVEDLEYALHELNDIDRQRADRWREIAHDLRGNVQIVSTVANGLRLGQHQAVRSERFLSMLEHNIRTLRDLLDDVTELTRLHAGQESRQIAPFNAGQLIGRLCEGLQAYAGSRNLYLRYNGPANLEVSGDAAKVTRIAQNLILNALKYTDEGGVDVSWNSLPGEGNRWVLAVHDTGPGFEAGPSAPITGALQQATEISDSVGTGEASGPEGSESPPTRNLASRLRHSRHQRAGEGIGLSIVKRLAELLDATVEVTSRATHGTTFRILLPVFYADQG